VFAFPGQRVYTGAMTSTPRQSTFTVETGDGYRLEITVKGFVDTDAETFAMEVLSLAAHAFNDVFAGPFKDQILDLYAHEFQARLDNEAKPSEFDLGWAAGRQAALLEAEQDGDPSRKRDGADMVGKVLEVTSDEGGHGFPVGTKVTIIHDSHDEDPHCQYLVTTVDALVAPDGPDAEDEFEDMWEEGVTAWVGPVNTKPWVDPEPEG
jgi:hypothetical protein